jgi:hypothetical protein
MNFPFSPVVHTLLVFNSVLRRLLKSNEFVERRSKIGSCIQHKYICAFLITNVWSENSAKREFTLRFSIITVGLSLPMNYECVTDMWAKIGHFLRARTANENLDYCFARGSIVVKALCYKPEGRGIDTR